MDDTEIVNSEYRQFVEWVKDSIVRMELAKLAENLGLTNEDDKTIGEWSFASSDTTNLNVWEKYQQMNYHGMGDDPYDGYKLNKDVDIEWDTRDYPDEFYSEVMDSLCRRRGV